MMYFNCNYIHVFYVVLHGLFSAMDELLPRVKQRFCVSHLYNNFRKKYPGKLLKEIIWKDAKSTYLQAWERQMKALKVVNA